MESKPLQNCDVCIVGAGFSGLMAASLLHEQGKKVVVVEARNRLGGRTFTEEIGEGESRLTLDVGGQWIGPTQLRINRLVRKWNIPIFSTYDSGENVIALQTKLIRYSGTIPKLNPIVLADLGVAMARLDKLAKKIDRQNPWNTPNATALDSVSLAYWVKKNTWTQTASEILWGGLQMLFSTELARISLLHALYVIHVCDGLDVLFGVKGGAQQDRFVGGTKTLLDKLAEPFLNQIILENPVRAIKQSDKDVTIVSDKGSVQAKRVIVAIPPMLQTKIEFLPELLQDKNIINHTMPLGSVVKVFCIYPNPFWRKVGLSGQGVYNKAYLFSTFDNSLPNRSEGILVGFAVGEMALQLQRFDDVKRKQLILNDLVRIFGREAGMPTSYNEHIWSKEKWSQGAFFGNFPTGILSNYGQALWEPYGRIHWAGTETARSWMGYIEGALESGERTASEVLPLL